MLKHLKWYELICGIILLAAGAVLLVKPELTLELITRAIGGALIIAGIMFVLGFIIRRTPNLDSNSLVTGTIAIAAGAYIFIKYADFIKIVPMMLGIGAIVSGIFKLQRSLELAKMHYRSWVWIIIAALLNIMAGLIIVLNPAMIANIIMKIIGIVLIYSGALDIITTIFISHRFSVYMAEKAEKEVAGTAREDDASEIHDQPYVYDTFEDQSYAPQDTTGDDTAPGTSWEETEL